MFTSIPLHTLFFYKNYLLDDGKRNNEFYKLLSTRVFPYV